MKSPFHILASIALIALSACVSDQPTQVGGKLNPVNPNTPVNPTDPTNPTSPLNPTNPTIPPPTSINTVAIGCNSERVNNAVLLPNMPNSPILGPCGNPPGPAQHFTFVSQVPSLVRVNVSDTDLVNAYVMAPDPVAGAICVTAGPSVRFAAASNIQYVVAVTTGVANVGDDYDLSIDCDN